MGALISLLSSSYGLPETATVVVARALREAGWLTSGARGINAPDMGARDAARLSLALLSGEPPSNVVSVFELLRTLRTPDEYPDSGLIDQEVLPRGHTLEDAMTALFEVSSDPELIAEYGRTQTVDVMFMESGPAGAHDHDMISHVTWPRFSVSVDMSRRTAEVQMMGHAFHYLDLAGRERLTLLRAQQPFTLDATEQILEQMIRSPSANDVDGIVEGRGMRVIRTITEQEFQYVIQASPGIRWSTGR